MLLGFLEPMGDAKVKAICSVCMKEFEKLLFVANLAHGDEFLSEARSYF